jgi:hypothetical protein
MISIYVSYELAAWQILLMTKKQKTQQSTMSKILHCQDDNSYDELNSSHDVTVLPFDRSIFLDKEDYR